jgi:hypothetical protein
MMPPCTDLPVARDSSRGDRTTRSVLRPIGHRRPGTLGEHARWGPGRARGAGRFVRD